MSDHHSAKVEMWLQTGWLEIRSSGPDELIPRPTRGLLEVIIDGEATMAEIEITSIKYRKVGAK